ncbi:MAG: TolC family protein, partial [Lentisphaeria bacterium]|nr:TolC family protein [Lentisphaeria bacterium]
EHLAKVGVSLPLPIFDRRRGHREAARHHLSQVGAEAAAVRLVLHSELRQAWQEAATAMAAVAAIRQGLLVETRQLLQEAEESYRQGKSSYLELLNAQQTWQELNLEYIDALAEAHRHLVAIDRLTARPTTPPSSQQQKGNNP